MTNKELSLFFKNARKEMGFTMKELAHKVNMSPSTINRAESDSFNLKIINIKKILSVITDKKLEIRLIEK